MGRFKRLVESEEAMEKFIVDYKIPNTSLESKNISTIFPPIFCTMAIPCNKASYSASLFVAENPSLRDFSMIVFLGDIGTSLTPDPL